MHQERHGFRNWVPAPLLYSIVTLAVGCSDAGGAALAGAAVRDNARSGSSQTVGGPSAAAGSIAGPGADLAAAANVGGSAPGAAGADPGGSAPANAGAAGAGGPDEPQGAASVEDLEVGDRSLDRDFEDLKLPGKHGPTTFAFWAPGDIKRLRGFVIGSGRNVHARELARLENFALLSVADWDNAGSREDWLSLLDVALHRFAIDSGHSELPFLPFVGTGHSRSSGPIFFVNDYWPERCIAGSPGGLEYVPPEGAPRSTPFLIWYGSVDATQSRLHVQNLQLLRAEGARYGIAPQWGGGHSWSRGTNLSHVLFAQAIARRLPKVSSPTELPVLADVPEASGWLGARNGWLTEPDGRVKYITPASFAQVSSFEKFQGERADAVWLLDSYVAATWRAFVTPDETVQLTDPAPQNSEDRAPVTMVEPGATMTVAYTVKGPPGSVQTVALYDGDLRLASSPAQQGGFPNVALRAGVHALIAIATLGNGQRISSRPSTIYVMRQACPTELADDFPIHCVKKHQ